MSSVMNHDVYKKEVKEEPFECVDAKAPAEAVPFDDSKPVPIAIMNGKVVNDDDIIEADVLVQNGKISLVGKELELPSDTHIIDATDKFVMPGAVNCDARLLQTCHDQMEQLSARTKSAVAGGTTTVIDGAQAGKHDHLVGELSGEEESSLYCHVGVKCCSNDTSVSIQTLKGDSGRIISVHLSGEAAFNLEATELLNLMKEVKEEGGVLCVDVKGGALDEDILEGRSMITPVEDLEEILVRKLCSSALQVGITVGLFNVCNPWCIQIIQEFRVRGLSAFSDILTNMTNISAILPLDDNTGLILASNNLILNEDQEGENDDSPEDWLSVAYHQLVNENNVSASKFVEITSTNPARLHNMFPNKGCIREGSDADIIIWDPTRSVQVPESGSYRSHLGVEKGAELYGVAEHVLVAGRLVVTDCQVRPTACYGSYVQFSKMSAGNCDVTDGEHGVVPVKRADIPGYEQKAQEVNRRPQSAWDRRKLTANTPASQPTPSGPSTKMDKEIGMYQRPKTAHGVRNQQDSTFSIKSFW